MILLLGLNKPNPIRRGVTRPNQPTTRCTGTTMRDYLRAADLAHLPDEVVTMYDDGTAIEGRKAVFDAQVA